MCIRDSYNAYNMCIELPKVAFLAMDARHCAGSEMAELMAYGASVGAAKAKAKANAIGFVGCAWATLVCYFSMSLLSYFLSKKHFFMIKQDE